MMIPLTVLDNQQERYCEHMRIVTSNFTRTILFAYDHRLEHLQYDFYGDGVAKDAYSVEHALTIAAKSKMSAFATQFGLIARYARSFDSVPYVVKLTGKVPVRTFTDDAYNYSLCCVKDVVDLQQNTGLCIPGVAAVIYLGSTFEHDMIQFASETIREAHKQGLVAFLFIYLRGNINKDDSMLLAGAAGVANVLGADFVKLHVPNDISVEDAKKIKRAAGNTRLLYAGKERVDEKTLLDRISLQTSHNLCDGVALGRNLFQRTAQDAVTLVDRIVRME